MLFSLPFCDMYRSGWAILHWSRHPFSSGYFPPLSYANISYCGGPCSISIVYTRTHKAKRMKQREEKGRKEGDGGRKVTCLSIAAMQPSYRTLFYEYWVKRCQKSLPLGHMFHTNRALRWQSFGFSSPLSLPSAYGSGNVASCGFAFYWYFSRLCAEYV